MWDGGVKLSSILLLCVVNAHPSPCDLQYDAGPCRGLKSVVAFEDGKCVPKKYGGCGGNDNRFDSVKECEATCGHVLNQKFTPSNPICLEAAVTSTRACRGMFPRFTFNSEAGRCEKIVYGGCGAGANMFLTMEECTGVCMEAGTQAGSQTIVFPAEADLEQDDICSLPPVTPGPMSCLGFAKMWTFSQSQGGCVPYVYGGCRGTKNLFATKEACEAECSNRSSKSVTAEVCGLPLSSGPCEAYMPSFGFNSETGRCESFVYGGCKGNGNRFSNVEDCVNTCGGSSDPVTHSDTEKCKHVQCDTAEANLKTSQGCSPVTGPGECCPSSWDCGAWQRRLEAPAQCWYQGSLYSPGQDIPEVSEANGCNQACQCSLNTRGLAEIVCAVVDCAPGPEGCRANFSSPGQCCTESFTCGQDLEQLPTCQLDGRTYYAGEKMYPEADRCVTCLCQEGWDGDLRGQFCSSVKCDLSLAGDKLVRGCKPLYREGVCCNTDWVCPEDLQPAKLTGSTKSSIKTEDKCLLPKDIGPCKMAKEMYYFDVATRTCSSFLFGGCKGNENRFSSLEECESSCGDFMAARNVNDAQSRCELDKAPGKCRGFQKKFYFNNKSGRCNEFVYTGCQGNDNRFDSLDECEASCKVVKDLSPKPGKDEEKCSGPVVIGRCRSRIEKYYYDTATGGCNKFYYSGCGGGLNMFDTSSECRVTCVQPQFASRAAVVQDLFVSPPCEQERDAGPCRAAKPRWFYNKSSGTCDTFLFGGCRGNDNNFASRAECEAKCDVAIDVTTLPGFGKLPENIPPHLKEVIGGRSGGCPGCPSSAEVTPEVKMVAGHGVKKLSALLSTIKRVGGSSECGSRLVLVEIKDVKTQVVSGKNFIFTLTLESRTGADCSERTRRTCSGIHVYKPWSCKQENYAACLEIVRTEKISCDVVDHIVVDDVDYGETLVVPEINLEVEDEEFDPCFMEKTVGRCKGAFNRFYFEPKTKTCEPFKYGGCMGNPNNFADKKSCEQTCGKHISPKKPRNLRPTPINPVCQLAMEAGPCYALMPRFFFNFETRRCEQFIYGGCRGNENNFGTMQECVSSCGKHPRGLPQVAPAEEERCQLGEETFAIGDILRLPGPECRVCVCSSPPDLSCHALTCPLRAFLPPPGGVNCVMQTDSLGCCDAGYKCDTAPGPPAPPPAGGSFPVLGGYGGSEDIGHEQKIIAATATTSFLSTLSGVTGEECDHLTLVEVVNFSRQIVAGTNFRLTLRLRSRSGTDCSEVVERVCENIVLYRPLPYACTPSKDNSQCLTLSRPENISCQ